MATKVTKIVGSIMVVKKDKCLVRPPSFLSLVRRSDEGRSGTQKLDFLQSRQDLISSFSYNIVSSSGKF